MMIWRLFEKSVHVKPVGPHGPTVDRGVIKWMTVECRNYESLWDDKRRYGWRVFLHNLLVTLGVPFQWLVTDVTEED